MDERKIKRCKKCGTERHVGEKCAVCLKNRQAEWYQQNKERIQLNSQSEEFKQNRREKWNKYRADHLEEVRAKEHRWRENNKERDRERKRNNEIINPRTKTWEQKATQRCNKRATQKGVPRGMKSSDLYDPNTGELPIYCPIFPHIKLDYTSGPDMRLWASVDRKVPELGYTSGNVWIISMAANTWKSNGSNPAERAIISKFMASKQIEIKTSDEQLPLF